MEDHPQRDYAAAKLELLNVLSLMELPKEKRDAKTFVSQWELVGMR